MKNLMLLLALGLVSTEKLDRTYLPPPGSKFSGGSPGDLDVPLEFPKESYTTTAPFQRGHGSITPEDTRLTVGTDRIGSKTPGQSKDLVPVTPATSPFTYYPKVPTTTTSYAFTQTTTFPPSEGFETTINPIVGFPFDGPIGELPGQFPSNQPHIFNQQTNLPGFIQTGSEVAQKPGAVPLPGGQSALDGRPGYNQNLNQYQQNLPSSTPSSISGRPGYTQNVNQYQQTLPASTVSPTQGLPEIQQGVVTPQNQGFTQHLGVQPPRQFGQQFPSTTAAPSYQTGLPSSLPTPTPQGYLSTYQPNISTSYNGQGPQAVFSGYPSGGPPQFNNVKSAHIPGSRPGSNVLQQPQFIGQQPVQILGQPGQQSLVPTAGPQTTQYIDQYGNLQTVPSGTTVPQFGGQQQFTGQFVPSTISPPTVRNQNVPSQSGTNQYGGEIKSIQGTTSFAPGQQGIQGPQIIGQPGFVPSTVSLQGVSGPGLQGFVPSTVNPISPGQQGLISSTVQPQVNVPGQQIFVPSTVNPQGTVVPGIQGFIPSTVSPQGSFISGSVSAQGVQNPQLVGQVYPTGSPQGTNLQQSLQGSQYPGYSQTTGQPLQPGQPGSFPSTVASQGFSSVYPTGSTPAISPQGISSGSQQIQPQNYPGQQTQLISGSYPGNQQNIPQQNVQNISPTGSLISNGKAPQPQFSTQRPVDFQKIYQPVSTVPTFVPLGYNQTVSPSAPSFPTSGTTPGVYSPTTPRYPGTLNQGIVPSGIKGVPSSSINIIPRPERPQAESDRNAVIINYDNNLEKFPDEFAYSFDTSNGIHADENGTATDGVKADGSYSYIGDDGIFYKVVYTADENGFRPQGDHIPTPPPVPEAIQRVIDQAKKDKEAGISHDGFYDEAKYGHKKYQRPKHRRPQNEERIVTNGADIPDEYESNYEGSINKKKPTLQSGNRPAEASDADNETEQDQLDFDDHSKISTDGKIRPSGGKLPSRRPSYKKPGQSGYGQQSKDRYDDDNESIKSQETQPDDKDRFVPGRNKIKGRPFSGNKNRPTSYDEQYDVREDEDPFPENSVNVNRPGQSIPGRKGFQRRPTGENKNKPTSNDDQYDVNEDLQESDGGAYENKLEQGIPGKESLRGRPVGGNKNRPTSYDDNYGMNDNENIKDGGDIRPGYAVSNKKDFQKRPSGGSKNKPTTYEDKYEVDKDKDSFTTTGEFKTKPKQMFGKDTIQFPSKTGAPTFDESDIEFDNVPGRLNMLKKTVIGRPQGVSLPEFTRYDNEDIDVTDQSFDRDGRPQRPLKGPYKKVGPNNPVSDVNSEDYYPKTQSPKEEGRLRGSKRPVFTDNRDRLSSKQRPDDNIDHIDRRPGVVSQDGEGTKDDNISVKQDGQPSFNKQTKVMINKYPQQEIDEETGYQYNPPQDNFQQTQDKFPSRFHEEPERPTSKRPSKYNSDQQTTVRPFITPNVYSNENVSYEDNSEERLPTRKPGLKNITPTTASTEDDYDITASEIEDDSDQDIGDDVTTSIGIRPLKPGKKGFTRRPYYPGQQTGRPQTEDYEEDEVIQKGTLRPGQKGGHSTYDHRPGQDSVTSRTPDYVSSSTTPMPPRGPSRGTKRPQGSQRHEYPTTYKTTDNVVEDYSEGTTRPGVTTTKSRKPGTGLGGYYDSTNSYQPGVRIIPTSRPSYPYSDKTTLPGSTAVPETSRPAFDTPSQRPGETSGGILGSDINKRPGSVIQSSRPTTAPVDGYFNQNLPGTTFTPGSSIPDRTFYPGSTVTTPTASVPEQNSVVPGQTLIPGQTETQNIPSTTYRPNYSTGMTQPGQTVDAFGRPINQLETSRIPGSVSPGQRTDLFNKPVEFGPSSKKTPAYLSPFNPSTERVKGEDFSGPKQPQRFDPETGYHY